MYRKFSLFRTLALALLVATPILSGCTKDTIEEPPTPILPPTSEDNVLSNLQVSYRTKNVEEYAKLLASDFQFYFDSKTRSEKGLPPFWTRLQDSTQTERLFTSNEVSDITIALKWPHNSAKPANQIGREDWTYLDILDVSLDVDMAPTSDNPEGITWRVEDQRQRFFFRRGKTKPAAPGDTLMYIVQWEDYGAAASPSGGQATFSAVKTN